MFFDSLVVVVVVVVVVRVSTGTGIGTVPGRKNVASVRSRNIFCSGAGTCILARYLAYNIVMLLLIQPLNVVYFARYINTCMTSV